MTVKIICPQVMCKWNSSNKKQTSGLCFFEGNLILTEVDVGEYADHECSHDECLQCNQFKWDERKVLRD